MMRFIILNLFIFFHATVCQDILIKKAEFVLNRVEYELPVPSIIGKHEWKELQLDAVIEMLARTTKTPFGSWGLGKLLHPVADKDELVQRKKIIIFLAEHEDVMHDFQKQLGQVQKAAKSVLAYFDKHDQLNDRAKQFYFTVLGLTELNKSSLALNASAIMEMFTSVKYFATMLALKGVTQEWKNWRYGLKDDFSVLRGLKTGFKVPLMEHYPYRHLLPDPALGAYTYQDALKVLDDDSGASWGDRWAISYHGYTLDTEKLGWLGMLLPSDNKWGFVFSFISATMPVVYHDYLWGSALARVGRSILSMYTTLDLLQQRVADVAQCMQSIQKLQKIVTNHVPELSVSMQHEDDYAFKRKALFNNLLVPRFLNKSDYIYSRGHVLTMHLELMQEKKALIPLLQSIAILDAYCSIAQLYKESQNQEVTFCFPEFIESERPCLQYNAAWLPLLSSEKAVTNDLFLGCGQSGKMVLTGPNGSGKSTILKTLGIGVILAQSGLPVPAQQARQTLFTELKTNLVAEEDRERELSKGMAGMKVMDELKQAIGTSVGKRMLVLIDEPYGGMVDAEKAKRIYLFGKDIADYSNVLVALATHTKKPMQLAQDTGGLFANYQVKINEIRLGEFERLFKLEQGPALWWFEDEDKRGRFVDWLAGVANRKR